MKRILSALLALAFLFCAGTAMAEEIVLSALSDEEIIALRNRVQAEFVDRHIEATATLRSGAYLAGRDFPAGTYIYTCLAIGDDWGNVTIYTDGGDGDQVFWKIVSAPEKDEEPEAYFITISDGDQLKSAVPFSLTIYAGATFM